MKNGAIIGTFTGQCADANITNLNGLDITREVWENVFNSDEYKRGIKLGHFIGFLGHPEGDPACQDFEHACIVMTDGRIDSDGKVYGSFNLVDTPVGRIVKSFIDAGVTFGISVRGAGDIIDNSVDPDTFVFRGFDLVAFPAYPDAIPKFNAIAASSNAAKQQKYKKVCAAVHNNIGSIDSLSVLDTMQKCVASQSKPYKEIAERKSVIKRNSVPIEARKLNAMTMMYLKASDDAKRQRRRAVNAISAADRKSIRIRQIMASQFNLMQKRYDKEVAAHDADVRDLRATLADTRAALMTTRDEVTASKRAARALRNDLKNAEQTNSRLSSQLKDSRTAQRQLSADIRASEAENDQLAKENLIYTRKLDEANSELAGHRADVSEMQTTIDETVAASTRMQSKMSNLDKENKKLVAANQELSRNLSAYQTAYAELYATVTGGNSQVAITASTRVDELNRQISGVTQIAAPLTTEVVYTDVDMSDDSLTTL